MGGVWDWSDTEDEAPGFGRRYLASGVLATPAGAGDYRVRIGLRGSGRAGCGRTCDAESNR